MIEENDPELEDENPFAKSDDISDEDFSIDQLRDAYAKVLKEQKGESADETVDDDPPVDESDDSESDDDDVLDDAPCAVSPKSILEAVLFVGAPKGETLTARKIAALMRDVSPKEIKQMVKELNHSYEQDGSAYRIAQEKTSYRMELRDDFAKVKENFYGEVRIAKLSQPAVDVLAVVAYHQPIDRDRVDKIRIRPSGSILNQLVRRKLLEIQATDSKPKKRMYTTTNRFLELFGLETLEDLPQSHETGSLDDIGS
jgi:segregation and condensation protein B